MATKRKRSSQEQDSHSRPLKVLKENEDDLNVSQNPDFPTMGEEADVGIIEKVSLKNFMCHNRLDVPFYPRVNFITGRNGSGKSAVLTAMVVGLGGKANLTSRGSSIKNFIKSGKSSAEVVIRLRNRGADAYRPDDYGKSITVERKFTNDGGSQYRLKSSDGRLVSTKREELAHILDQFNIQVENPVAILNQDTSRNFLHSKSPHDKYKFFLKATQLEQMKHDYAVADEQRVVTMDIMKEKQEKLPGLEKEVFEWEQKFKALASLDALKEKVKKLKDEMAWAHVYSKEKGLEPLQKELKQEEARTPKFEQKVKEAQAEVQKYEEEYKMIQDKLRALGEEVEQLKPQHEQAKKLLNQKKAALKHIQNDLKGCQSELKALRGDREQTVERINEIKNSAKQDYEAERLEREAKTQLLQDRIDTLRAQQKTTEHQIEQFRNAITKYKEDSYALKTEERDIKMNVDQLGRELRDLEASRNNRVRRFGQWVPDLMNRIETAHRSGKFHQKPRGPLGVHISVREQMWALAIESCVKGLLHAFCCHDHHDERELEKIFQQVCPAGRKPTTIVSAFQRVQHPQYPTVLDTLEIQDPVIFNCLVDQRGIESILLIRDNNEAREVMSKKPPKNCREAFTGLGDQVQCHPIYRYYSNKEDKVKWLTVNVEDSIRNTREQLANTQTDYKKVQNQLVELNGEIRRNQNQEKRSETALMKTRDEIGRLAFEMSELNSIEDPAPVDVTTLEEEVHNFDEQIHELEEKEACVKTSMEAAKEETGKANEAFQQVDQRIHAVADSSDPIKESLARTQIEIEKAKSHRKKHYEAKMKEHEKKVAECRRLYEQHKKELDEDTAKAKQICDPIKTRRTAKNLESEIEQIIKQIKTEEKNRGNQEEITRKYYDTKDKFIKIKHEVNQLKTFLDKLDVAMQVRIKRYARFRNSCSLRAKLFFNIIIETTRRVTKMPKLKIQVSHTKERVDLSCLQDVMVHRQQQYFEFRRMIAMRAKYFFIVMLSNRNYTGKINFNHQKEMLSLSVQPSEDKSKDGSKDMRALSGGERSFSTVCFILALWDAMESPFRCLDEFDVFMDMVNRRISMEMMMSVARQQKGRQFIFLTPLDMSQMKASDSVHIFRMQDPSRGQTVLPFESIQNQQEEED